MTDNIHFGKNIFEPNDWHQFQVFQFLFATVSIAHGSPIQFKSKQSGYGDGHNKKAQGGDNHGTDRLIGKLTHLQEDPFQWEPVTESGFASRAPRATTPQDISGKLLHNLSKAFVIC